jgi:P4 family phage/plasmid primase-like protien
MIDALRAVCHKAADAFAPPCWLDGEGPFPAGETLAFTDGLLHLATMRFEPPTPNFFTRNALSYSFDPFAPKPRAWLQFLKSIFEGSPGSADTLQEIFGYMLLPDTSLQKAFIWDSPPRGGKGTTGRVLQKLIGDHNCVSPGFKGLATPSILTSMIGKQAAIISDMRLSKSADLSSIMENLLRITGEDSLTFDRKYKDAWTGRLLVRFFIFTNLSLAVPDVSAALINRFIALRSFESFLGREDAMLESRLLEDLPGILLWAIEGWRRLKARGRFQQTPEGESMLQQMIDLASPIPSFLRECCELDPKASVTKDDLYAAWDNWANTKGVPDLAENAFARFLLAAGHGKIRDKRGSHEGRRFTGWQGVGLRMEFG